MKILWRWTKALFGVFGFLGQVVKMEGQVEKTIKDLKQAIAKMERNEVESSKLKTKLEQGEEKLTQLREKLKIAEEITIPTLISNLKMFQERWDAETKEQVYRRVMATPSKGSEE